MGLREVLSRRRRRRAGGEAAAAEPAVRFVAAPVAELAQAALQPPPGTPAPRAGGAGAEPGRVPGPRSGDAAERAVIRAWAREHGMVVSDRGRIPARVLEAYRSAH